MARYPIGLREWDILDLLVRSRTEAQTVIGVSKSRVCYWFMARSLVRKLWPIGTTYSAMIIFPDVVVPLSRSCLYFPKTCYRGT